MTALSRHQTGLANHWMVRYVRRALAIHPLLLVLSFILLAPVIAIAIVAIGPSDDLMPHLLQTVLGRYIKNTLLLMGGVGSLAIIFGVSTAWLVSRYHFAGRGWLEWLLVLPAAMPALSLIHI